MRHIVGAPHDRVASRDEMSKAGGRHLSSAGFVVYVFSRLYGWRSQVCERPSSDTPIYPRTTSFCPPSSSVILHL